MFEFKIATILVAEDSDEDFEILAWACAEADMKNPLVRARSGEDVIRIMRARLDSDDELPLLIILDLNLIGMGGQDVLKTLKNDERLRKVPVIVLSTSDNPRDVEACYQEGANAYSVKPLDLDRFVAFARQIKAYWLDFVILPRRGRQPQLGGRL